MGHLDRVSLVTLGVRDIAASTRFYAALGWHVSSASQPTITFLRSATVALGLYGRDALAEDARVTADGTGFRATALAANVPAREDVDAALAHAERAGARVVKPAEDAFWGGRSGYFADPDGHLWEVAWNPHAQVDDAGRMALPD